ncbi:hypothetical protein Tco_1217571 [Tanacetum coccineum]
MSTYLKHVGGYTYKQLKGKSFDEIQKLFEKEMKRHKEDVGRKRAGEKSNNRGILKGNKDGGRTKSQMKLKNYNKVVMFGTLSVDKQQMKVPKDIS